MNDIAFLLIKTPSRSIKERWTIIDSEDLNRVLIHTENWSMHDTGYAIGYSKIWKKKIRLSRLIMNVAEKYENKMQTDHINKNRLDNRKINLRLLVAKDNNLMSRPAPYLWYEKKRHRTSKFKNVSWHKSIKKWTVAMRRNRKLIQGGYFISEIEAAKRANELMLLHIGPDAPFNIIP